MSFMHNMVDIVEYQRVVNKAGMYLHRNGQPELAEELRSATVEFTKSLMKMHEANLMAESTRRKAKPLKVVFV